MVCSLFSDELGGGRAVEVEEVELWWIDLERELLFIFIAGSHNCNALSDRSLVIGHLCQSYSICTTCHTPKFVELVLLDHSR